MRNDYEDMEEESLPEVHVKRRKKSNKVVIFIIELFILLAALAALYVWQSLDKIERDEVKSPLELHVNKDLSVETIESMQGYVDIALFGVDNRSNGDTDTGHSDVIMIASINKDTKDIKLVSVYRDTFLDTDIDRDSSPNFNKANRAYMIGGAEQAVKMLNANLDLDIERYVTVDFKAVTDMVDLVGGVDIDIDSAELKWMNSYIDTTAAVTGAKANHISSTGVQHLDGNQATAYARIRYTKGDDYARSARQREVINEIVKKLKKADIGTVNNIINTIFPEISTNFTNMEILSLAKDALSYNLSQTVGFPFNKRAGDAGGKKGSVVFAMDLESNVTALHKFLYEDEAYYPSSLIREYSASINEKYNTAIDRGDAPEAVTGEGSISLDEFARE